MWCHHEADHACRVHSYGREQRGDDADTPAKDGPDRPEVPGAHGDRECHPDAEHQQRRRQVSGKVNLYAAARSRDPGRAAVGVAPGNPLDRQVAKRLIHR